MNQRNVSSARVIHSVVIAIISLIIGFHTAQAEITVWGMKGEPWKEVSSVEKSMYLQGFLDGLIFAGGQVQGEKISYTTSHDHLIRALDQFYSDYRNELIPVPFALKVVSIELSGREKVEIDKQLESLRKDFLGFPRSKAQQPAPQDVGKPRR